MCKFIGQFIANCSLEEHSNKASKHVTIPQVYLQVNFPVNLQIVKFRNSVLCAVRWQREM